MEKMLQLIYFTLFFTNQVFGAMESAGAIIARVNEQFNVNDEKEVILPENVHSGSQQSTHYDNRWKDGIVYYRISDEYSEEEKEKIRFGPRTISEVTCVKFIELYGPQPESLHHIYVQNLQGCYSFIGYSKPYETPGYQTLSLMARGCLYESVIVHEFIHALAVFHEQSRPDRDDYIDIHFENIRSGMERNFAIHEDMDTRGIPYDGKSIMHYTKYTFTANNQPTITWKGDSKLELGGNVMTKNDIEQINRLYNCPTSTPTTTTPEPTTTTTPEPTTTTPEPTTTTPEPTTTTPEPTTTTTPEPTTTTPEPTTTTTPEPTTSTQKPTTTFAPIIDCSKKDEDWCEQLIPNKALFCVGVYLETCPTMCGKCNKIPTPTCDRYYDYWYHCKKFVNFYGCRRLHWTKFVCKRSCCTQESYK